MHLLAIYPPDSDLPSSLHSSSKMVPCFTRVFRMLGPYVKHLKISHFTSFTLCLFYAMLSVSLPTFNNMDVSRINYNSTQVNDTGGIDQIRFGIWNFCLYRRSLDTDPCHSFAPCNFTGTYRLCSPYGYGYDVLIRPGNLVSAQHVSANWTRALVSNVAAGGFAFFNSLLILIRRPSGLAAMVATGSAISAACISFAFDVKCGGPDGPGLAVSIVLAILSCFQWCITNVERNALRSQRQRRSPYPWVLTPGRTIGPIKVVKLGSGEKEGRQSGSNLIGVRDCSTFECAICWEAVDSLLALHCTHVFCSRCAKSCIKSFDRCPACRSPYATGRRPINDLRTVYSVVDPAANVGASNA